MLSPFQRAVTAGPAAIRGAAQSQLEHDAEKYEADFGQHHAPAY